MVVLMVLIVLFCYMDFRWIVVEVMGMTMVVVVVEALVPGVVRRKPFLGLQPNVDMAAI
jgi:hypothetical protein